VRLIETAEAPTHTGPVTQAVEAGGWIYVSALFGADPTTHAIPADARDEAQQLFTNLSAILTAAGADLTDVVRVGIVMRALQRERPVFNQVWASGSETIARRDQRSRYRTSAARARTPAS
jgi:2-iminobutanoate/2-iminopropanoate deaminase